MSRVSALEVVVTRDSFPALADATFDLPEQHFTIVTGPNGSGKTTLLKAIAGRSPILRGHLKVWSEQREYSLPRELRQVVGYVGHNPSYMRHIRVDEHFELCKKLDQKHNREYVIDHKNLNELFDLQLRSRTRVENLSAGQQRRLNLASAFVRSTELLCVDEPHSSLDAHWKTRIDAIFAEQYENGRSFIVATHEPERFSSVMTHHIEVNSGICTLKKGAS